MSRSKEKDRSRRSGVNEIDFKTEVQNTGA
jgi:hypothetical protein